MSQPTPLTTAPSAPTGTTRGTEEARRNRRARHATWFAIGSGVLVAGVEAVLWFVDLGDPELTGIAWLLWLVVVGLMWLMVVLLAWAQRADARAWTAALQTLAGRPRGLPDDATDALLELRWNTRRDIATVSWDGIEVGRWAPGADGESLDGRGWHLVHPTRMPPGHLARDHSFEPGLRGLAELRIDRRHYLLSELSALLVDAEGNEWSLQDLLRPHVASTIGRVPRGLGADGAVFVLRAWQQMALLRTRRSSSST